MPSRASQRARSTRCPKVYRKPQRRPRSPLYLFAETLNEPMSDMRIAGYFLALQDLTIDDAKRAILLALMQQRRFFPTPGELRELLVGSVAEHADRLGELMREVQRVGYIGTPSARSIPLISISTRR